jgi:hypothetical protein
MKVEHSEGVKAMTDEQIEQAIEAIQAMLAAQAGEAAKVIEGTAEPAALPAPEAPSIEAALEAKRRRKLNRRMKEVDKDAVTDENSIRDKAPSSPIEGQRRGIS